MGYIFDDVFPLYNFKRAKLENYDIKFRLSEKDDERMMKRATTIASLCFNEYWMLCLMEVARV